MLNKKDLDLIVRFGPKEVTKTLGILRQKGTMLWHTLTSDRKLVDALLKQKLIENVGTMSIAISDRGREVLSFLNTPIGSNRSPSES